MRNIFLAVLTALTMFTGTAYGAAVIFSGSDVKTLKPNIDLNGNTKILSGSVDPTSSATSAPVGSVYMNTSNGNLYKKLDSGSSTNWEILGANAAGGVTYFDDFEANLISKVSTYDDGAAAASPVDGTGGSPSTLTASQETSSPLSAPYSYKVAKSAADGQGEGFAITSSPLSYIESTGGKPVYVSFSYRTSTNYATDDITVWVYRVGSNTLEQCFGSVGDNGLKKADTGAKYTCAFAGSSSDTSFRLIFHVATTNATAYDVFLDRLAAKAEAQVPGTIITPWQSFTPSGTWTTNTTYSGMKRRVGDSEEYQITVSLSGAPTGTFSITIPDSKSIDTGKVTSTTVGVSSFGAASANDTGTDNTTGVVVYASSTSVNIVGRGGSATPALWSASVPHTWATGDSVRLNFKVPISGWSAGTQVSTHESSLQTLKLRAVRSGSTQNITDANANTIVFDAVAESTHPGSFNTSTGVFTAPWAGYYFISTALRLDSYTANDVNIINIRKNSSTAFADLEDNDGTNWTHKAVTMLKLAKGDTIDVQSDSSADTSYSVTGSSIATQLTIMALPDFSVFSTFGTYEILSSTSSIKTPSTSGDYLAMTGNSIALTPGTWEVWGEILYNSSGSVGYTLDEYIWGSANGADSGSAPTQISTTAGVTQSYVRFGGGIDNHFLTTNHIITEGDKTVYLVPRALMSTPANARVSTYIYAKRLR